MRDHVTEDRISAYLDGELSLDERLLVEQQLAESEDLRLLFEDLRRVRSQLQALPKVKLANDFASRVVQQIEHMKGSPGAATLEPARRSQQPRRWRYPHPWWRSPAAILASVAAVVIIAFSLPRAPQPLRPSPIESMAVQTPVFLKQQPKLLLVYDVTVSPAGADNRLFPQLLKDSGVGFDPNLKLDGKLESELIALRGSAKHPGDMAAVPFKNEQEAKAAPERVEMVYLTGGATTIGRLGTELKKLADQGNEIRRMRFEMILEPKHIQVFKRLHDSAQFRFAESKGLGRSDLGVAFGLQFSVELTSLNVPEVASFSIPRLDIQVAATDAAKDLDLASGPNSTASFRQSTQAPDKLLKAELNAGKEAQTGDNEPSAVLVILRYPKQ